MKKGTKAPVKKQMPTIQSEKIWHYILLYLIPLILFSVSLLLMFTDFYINIRIYTNRLHPVNAKQIAVTAYPVAIKPIHPIISAQAAIIIDDTAKVVLYEKNADLRFPMASTTKLMTALTATQYFSNDAILTVQRSYVEGTTVGLYQGEQLYFRDLLPAMLIPSGNDAAYTIADNYPGGVTAFLGKMNETAKENNLDNTYYADPAGLDDDRDYTTAHDLARLTSLVLQNPQLAHIVSLRELLVSDVFGKEYDLINTNKLLGYEGVIGVKTGETRGAGGVLVTAKPEGGHLFIIIVMGSDDRFLDTEILLNQVTDNISFFMPRVSAITSIKQAEK